ncbi:MAG: hypothetical protein L3K23_06925 [Thermoplasmata archaeon]|nr:hypothetical protein [Thermoplasmata archaeon]
MITFVDLVFSPEGRPSTEVVTKLQTLEGISSVMGEHDVMFRWKTAAEFDRRMGSIHAALKGSGATYRVFTVEDSYQSRDPVPWISPLDGQPPHHPAYPEGEDRSSR